MNTPLPSVKPTILVAPLDWGLGHATRCIPIISALLDHNCQVLLAGEGKVKYLLSQEFPELEWLPLRGYAMRYSGNPSLLPLTILTQIPKILSVIQEEKQHLARWVKTRQIDGIISDNRYGLYHPGIPSAFITHQLRVRTGIAEGADSLLQRIHYRFINKFTECWVPDSRNEPSLSGKLGHPAKLPSAPVHYLGPLSRFKPSPAASSPNLLILLSGPEPQRTLFEQLISEELKSTILPAVLVRGLPGAAAPIFLPPHVRVFNHLKAHELQSAMGKASMVVARCGYSTVMDLMALEKKSILVPTPAQTEQEYLASHLMNQKLALCMEQKSFRLQEALRLAESFPYHPPPHQPRNLSVFLSHWLSRIHHR